MRENLTIVARKRVATANFAPHPALRGHLPPQGKALGFCSRILAEAVTHAGAAVVNGGGTAGNGHSGGHSPAENTLFLPIDHSCRVAF